MFLGFFLLLLVFSAKQSNPAEGVGRQQHDYQCREDTFARRV
jgi:hypothetical protein